MSNYTFLFYLTIKNFFYLFRILICRIFIMISQKNPGPENPAREKAQNFFDLESGAGQIGGVYKPDFNLVEGNHYHRILSDVPGQNFFG
jgi:hypothetical protein